MLGADTGVASGLEQGTGVETLQISVFYNRATFGGYGNENSRVLLPLLPLLKTASPAQDDLLISIRGIPTSPDRPILSGSGKM